MKGETERILESGVPELLTKPLDEELLLERVALRVEKQDFGRM